MANLGSLISSLTFPPNPLLNVRALTIYSQLWTPPSFQENNKTRKLIDILTVCTGDPYGLTGPSLLEVSKAILAFPEVHISMPITTDLLLPTLHDASSLANENRSVLSTRNFDLPQ